MRRLTTVVLFVSVLLGGSAAAFVTRSESTKPTPSPVKRLLRDALGSPSESTPPGGEKAAPSAPQEPAPATGSESPAPAPAADSGSQAPSSSPEQPASSPPTAKPVRLGPLQAVGGNPFPNLSPGAYAGYSSGTVAHADALQSGNNRLADVEVAFSGGAFTSSPLGIIHNEMSRVVAPTFQTSPNAYGRGSGLEVGLAVTPSGENQIVLPTKVEALASVTTDLITEEVGQLALDPLALARLLRGQAQGKLVSNPCLTSGDLAYGLGYAADVGLLDTVPGGSFDAPLVSTTAANPDRAVSQSVSRTALRGTVAPFGLTSETRQTIAPVTLFKGTPNQFTIEALGEWVLSVTANGTAGSASVHYGPAAASPETPVLRVINAANVVTNVLTLQQLLTNNGLTVTVPGGVAEIAIGEPPRALGGAGGSPPETSPTTGTLVSAAVDVARVRLLLQGQDHLADIRIGHMEAAVAVPSGGITCPPTTNEPPAPTREPEVLGAVEGVAVRPAGALPKTGGTAGPLLPLAFLALSGLLGGLSRRSARSPLDW